MIGIAGAAMCLAIPSAWVRLVLRAFRRHNEDLAAEAFVRAIARVKL